MTTANPVPSYGDQEHSPRLKGPEETTDRVYKTASENSDLTGIALASDADERIRRRAYEIWESEGRQHGYDERHWHRAVAEIGSETSSEAPEPPVPSPGVEQNAGAGPALASHSKDARTKGVSR